MYLKDKRHTLKMKESDSVRKHISTFRAYLQQLSATGSQVHDDETILTLMSRQPNLINFAGTYN